MEPTFQPLEPAPIPVPAEPPPAVSRPSLLRRGILTGAIAAPTPLI